MGLPHIPTVASDYWYRSVMNIVFIVYIIPDSHVSLLDSRLYMIHPKKLTWNLEMMVSNRNLLFQGSIFRFHVCFGGCTQ